MSKGSKSIVVSVLERTLSPFVQEKYLYPALVINEGWAVEVNVKPYSTSK